MRVIGGTARGTRLLCPAGRAIRPTPDRLRESLFGAIGPAVEAARVLDLFAGTGAIGIEALSRGAASCVFAERWPPALETIRCNLARTGLGARATILRVDLLRPRLPPLGEGFALAFASPPYGLYDDETGRRGLARLLEGLLEAGVLAPGGRLDLQFPRGRAREAEAVAAAYRIEARRLQGTNGFLTLAAPEEGAG